MTRLVTFVLLLSLASSVSAAAQITMPRGQWRTFETTHFRVHHPAPLDSIARVAAAHAERAHRQLSSEFVAPPQGRIDLIIADFADTPAGAATGLLRRIWINVHPALETREINLYDDDLSLIVTHELTHVFHGDHSGGMWKRLGRVFGLGVLTKMNTYASPLWLAEGLAVYFETRLTDSGRLRAPFYEMVLRTAALDDAFLSIDQASDGLSAWPGAKGGYAYGAYFVSHLVDRHGMERVNAFLGEVGSQTVPFRLNAAARHAFGRTLSASWTEWRDSLTTHYAETAESLRRDGLTEPEILTSEGGHAERPRYSPNGTTVAFAANTLREPSATRLISHDGRSRVVPRAGGLGSTSWMSDGESFVVSQLGVVDGHRFVADLFRVDLRGNHVRLTRNARLLEPDVHPDGERAIAVHTDGGAVSLVEVELATGTVRPFAREHGVQWTTPRWSPDGEQVAVARWRPGGVYDLVVLDASGSIVREFAGGRTVGMNPAWSPDGRYVVFSSDRSGIANLHAYDLEQDRLLQVTNVLTGAFEPDVSPDGRWIVFAFYQANGFRIARVPFEPAQWRTAPAEGIGRDMAAAVPAPEATESESRPYSAVRESTPLLWLPLAGYSQAMGVRLGGYAAGLDILGRHEYSASLGVFRSGRVAGALDYTYSGLGTAEVGLKLEQAWEQQHARYLANGGQDTVVLARLRRDRQVRATALFRMPGLGVSSWLEASVDARQLSYAWPDSEAAGAGASLPRRPLDVGAGLSFGRSTLRSSVLAVGGEGGMSGSASLQARHFTGPLPGQESATGYLRLGSAVTASRALDLPGFARHSVGARAVVGADLGPRSPGFELGGGSSGSSVPLRGYENGAQAGDRVAVAQLEYRAPLWLLDRGIGTVPVFFDRIWASSYFNLGTAWCADTCSLQPVTGDGPSPLASVGFEIAGRLSYLLAFRTDVRIGAALPLSEVPGGAQRRPQIYLETSIF